MLIVAPTGSTKLDTVRDTPKFWVAHLMLAGKVPELLVVVKAIICA